MSVKTIIAWTNKTWNPWRGCTKVSPGCKNCYMFTAQARYGRDPSQVVRTQTWGEPIKWQREAAATGRTELVFTCSWSDWFHVDADGWRDEAWALIRRCPNLTFQVLTKRSDRISAHLPADWGQGYPNVWLGVSLETEAYASRIRDLVKIPAIVRFVSNEPALGPISNVDLTGIDWLIYGGESGPGFREDKIEWRRIARDRCRKFGVKFFFKQSSAYRTEMGTTLDGKTIREYPTPRVAA